MRFDKESCTPPMAEWPTQIHENISRLKRFSELRNRIRRKLADEAKLYTDSLGINTNISSGSESTIVMTGHQPEIYHHGILYKNYVLQKFCQEKGALGINLIIDTDEGSAGTLIYPTEIEGAPGKRKLVLGDEIKPYFLQTLPLVLPEHGLLKDYAGLEGRPSVEAHTIVRRKHENAQHYLEIPLSRVLGFPEVREFIGAIVSDGRNFAEVYNETLDRYRKDEKIKNKANPFPDLKISDDGVELPFWLINSRDRSRQSYFLGNDFKGSIIAPKAALITLMARLLLCDLFIHGTGGAKYDKFTDKLIKSYFNIDPPVIVTATADRFFFQDQIKRYEKDKEASEKRRRMAFHPEKYLADFEVSDDLKNKIVNLINEKNQNIDKIKNGKIQKTSTAEYTQNIKRIEAEVKEIVAFILGPEEQFSEPSKVYLETIYSRDFSYLVFLDNF